MEIASDNQRSNDSADSDGAECLTTGENRTWAPHGNTGPYSIRRCGTGGMIPGKRCRGRKLLYDGRIGVLEEHREYGSTTRDSAYLEGGCATIVVTPMPGPLSPFEPLSFFAQASYRQLSCEHAFTAQHLGCSVVVPADMILTKGERLRTTCSSMLSVEVWFSRG